MFYNILRIFSYCCCSMKQFNVMFMKGMQQLKYFYNGQCLTKLELGISVGMLSNRYYINIFKALKLRMP